ncbi:MAG: glycosyltransferase family 4 protein [Victivallales bacterium]|nr:glycosyltransferase family 4 protein [Victivallales bacterium]
MKLAFCIFRYYPFGGLEKNFLRILMETASRGHSISVFTMGWEGDIPAFVEDKRIKIVDVRHRGITNHGRCMSFVMNVRPLLEAGAFDLVVGFNKMPWLDLYYCADVCFARVSKSKPFISRLTPRHRVFLELERAVFSPEGKTRILALSGIQKRIYREEYGTQDERFHEVPPGIEKDKIRSCLGKRAEFRARLGGSEACCMLLMIGSDFKRKGVSRSLRALAALPESIRSATRLFVIGKGDEPEMRSMAERLGVAGQTVFTGGVDNVPEFLAAADLLLHPALSENTGNAIVEALIAGVPVIATSNCGYAFHVLESGAGAVIEGDKFTQTSLNAKLAELIALHGEQFDKLRGKAILYSDSRDLYSRPVVIADIIEKLGV